MNKAIIKMTLAVMITGLLASGVYAAPVQLNDTQLDVVAAGGVEKVDGFVCPAIRGHGVVKNDKFFPIGDGYYSFHGPDVSVPVHATNGDGSGRPGGDFSKPGDKDYSAVWGFRP
jgi:hypothetical protein